MLANIADRRHRRFVRDGAHLYQEQDFILRVRRMQRLGTPYLVINLVLSTIERFAKHQGALESVQQQLQEFGWRIAFLLGAAIVPVGLLMRRNLPETFHASDAATSDPQG